MASRKPTRTQALFIFSRRLPSETWTEVEDVVRMDVWLSSVF